MEDKLTGKDFLAVIGILTIAGIIYGWSKLKEQQKEAAALGGTAQPQQVVIADLQPMVDNSNPFMVIYDTSQRNTIGTTDLNIKQPV